MQPAIGGGQQGLAARRRLHHREAVHVAGNETLVLVLPGHAAVLAAVDAADFDRAPDRSVVDGVKQNLRHPGRSCIDVGHGMTPGAVARVQVRPASVEREETGRPRAGGSRTSGWPDRQRPTTHPASATADAPIGRSARPSGTAPCRCRRTAARVSSGWLAIDQTRASRYMPEWLFG